MGAEPSVPLTCKRLADEALRLLGRVDLEGRVDEAKEARFYGMAPACLTQLQSEAALRLGEEAPPAVDSLDGTSQLEAGAAWHVLPAGLAMHFALAARDDAAYNHFSRLYYSDLLPSLAADELLPGDAYGVRGDATMQ